MAQTQFELRYVRFGAFEADLRTEELRKNGRKLKFSGQPFQILAILLAHPGELVTREELQNRVWPDTIVDVERNLNTAINKVREVLGDVTGGSRFIETLPRRGYRFIAAVETVPDPDAHSVEQRQGSPKESAVEINHESRPHSLAAQESELKRRDKGAFRWLAAMGISAIAIGAAWYLLHPLASPHITAHRQITHDGRPKQLIGTDGNRLYFNQDLGAIAQVPVSGGESAQIRVALEHLQGLADISPDGSNLLICARPDGWKANGQLWVVGIFGGAMRRLPDA